MGMSIWFGVRSSVCQMVIERLDGTYNERNEVGEAVPLYKIVVVTGNEDGSSRKRGDHALQHDSPRVHVPPTPTPIGSGKRALDRHTSKPGASSPLHAADQLLVRPQSAPHGADPARHPDPADREHPEEMGGDAMHIG